MKRLLYFNRLPKVHKTSFLYFYIFYEIIIAQLNAERSAEILFNLLDVDNNGDINEEEFIRS